MRENEMSEAAEQERQGWREYEGRAPTQFLASSVIIKKLRMNAGV
jgi:hypothetical protein